MTRPRTQRRVMVMDESGNLSGFTDDKEPLLSKPDNPSRANTRATVTLRQPDLPATESITQPAAEWLPEQPLPSHVEVMDEGPFDNPTLVTRSADGLRLSIANLRVVDRNGMDAARAEAMRLLQRMAPDLPVGQVPNWGTLLAILAATSQSQRALFDLWYERMAYLCLDGLWFSTEECLVGVHRPLPRGLALRKYDCAGQLCWRGGGMLWTDAQLAQARKPATWSSQLFRRLGWQ